MLKTSLSCKVKRTKKWRGEKRDPDRHCVMLKNVHFKKDLFFEDSKKNYLYSLILLI